MGNLELATELFHISGAYFVVSLFTYLLLEILWHSLIHLLSRGVRLFMSLNLVKFLATLARRLLSQRVNRMGFVISTDEGARDSLREVVWLKHY
jgi:hypothetical protein